MQIIGHTTNIESNLIRNMGSELKDKQSIQKSKFHCILLSFEENIAVDL